MIDLHTHILPAVDDGASGLDESLALLDMERGQGVDTVFLTPHFYRRRESVEDFLRRRSEAFDALRAALAGDAPALCLGAEVAWFPGLADEPLAERLCLGDSRFFLLELPFERWSARLFDGIYALTCTTGLTPILAHVERYLPAQSRDSLDGLLSLGLPMQINADSLLRFASRRRCMRLLERGRWLLASDCHSVAERPPRMAEALKFLRAKFGAEAADELVSWRPGD